MRLSRKMWLPFCLLLGGACACSIKEDRTDCPCLLEIRLTGGEEDRSILSFRSEREEFTDTLRCRSGAASFEYTVRKGFPELAIWSGQKACVRAGNRFEIPYGSEMDALYAWSGRVDATGESALCLASLHRQFAYVHLTVAFQDGESSPYLLTVRGDVSGMDLMTLEPLEGDFSVSFMPVIGAYHRICVPRQKDDSLLLEFHERDDTRTGGAPLGAFNLGEAIGRAGYDWKAADLEDIYVDVDYVTAGIEVSVSLWDEGDDYNITI